MFRIISVLIFKIKGWKVKIDPELIKNNKKFVLLGIPHTSNWDAVYFTGAIFLGKIKAHFLIKKEWMRFPFNLIFKPIGGIGVNNKPQNNGKPSIIIEEIVQLFNEKKELIIAMQSLRHVNSKAIEKKSDEAVLINGIREVAMGRV